MENVYTVNIANVYTWKLLIVIIFVRQPCPLSRPHFEVFYLVLCAHIYVCIIQNVLLIVLYIMPNDKRQNAITMRTERKL